ncbi:hypothetical protein [Paludibacterium purpuratum]|uniref:hypothetical protein n=1 Tax=Paludibacterium purpuratum TaxID=1144873 RepID=UPI00105DA403|nr:hypothetical protein [Paludibacterium purpuratum]
MIKFIYIFIINSLGVLLAFNAAGLALLLAKPIVFWISTGNLLLQWHFSDIKIIFGDEYALIGISIFIGFVLTLNAFKKFF